MLGMEILRDKKVSKLYLRQKGYIEKVFHRFNMQNAKPVSTLLVTHLDFHLLYLHNQMVMFITYHKFHILVQWGLSRMLWFVHIQIYYMQSMQSINTWQILVKNIGKQFSQFSDTYMAILMFVCILGELEMESLGMSILILLVTLQGMFLFLLVMLLVGKLLCKLQLLCLLLRLST